MTRDALPQRWTAGVVLMGLMLGVLAGSARAQERPEGLAAMPPPPVPTSPRIEHPAPGEVLHTRTPVLEGVGDPDTRVELELNGQVLARIRSDEQGRWSYAVRNGEALEVGSHRAVAYGVGVAQERSEPSVAVQFDIQPYDLEVTGCGSTDGRPGLALLGLLALAALRRRRPA